MQAMRDDTSTPATPLVSSHLQESRLARKQRRWEPIRDLLQKATANNRKLHPDTMKQGSSPKDDRRASNFPDTRHNSNNYHSTDRNLSALSMRQQQQQQDLSNTRPLSDPPSPAPLLSLNSRQPPRPAVGSAVAATPTLHRPARPHPLASTREQARIGSMRKATKLAALRQKRAVNPISPHGQQPTAVKGAAAGIEVASPSPRHYSNDARAGCPRESDTEDEAFFDNSTLDALLREISSAGDDAPARVQTGVKLGGETLPSPAPKRTPVDVHIDVPATEKGAVGELMQYTPSTRAKGYQFPPTDSPTTDVTEPEFTINIPRTSLTGALPYPSDGITGRDPHHADKRRGGRKHSSSLSSLQDKRGANATGLRGSNTRHVASDVGAEIIALQAENAKMDAELKSMRSMLNALSKLVLTSKEANEAELAELRRLVGCMGESSLAQDLDNTSDTGVCPAVARMASVSPFVRYGS